MSLGIGEAFILGLIIVIIFGTGRLPKLMGDLGRGLRSFKDGMAFAATRTDDPPQTRTGDPSADTTRTDAHPPNGAP